MEAKMNVYRSIGGRANTSGVERIDRDGQMQKLQMGEAEVTAHERMQWNAKCGKDKRGNLVEDFYEVEKDESHGNSMAVDSVSSSDMTRVRFPRPHQHSTEARLSGQRGDKIEFPKSDATAGEAFGVRDGMVLSENDTRNFDMKEAKKQLKENDEEKTKAGKVVTASTDTNLIDAFVRVAKIMSESGKLEVEDVVGISSDYDVRIEDIFMLEKVAEKNPELMKKYAQCPFCPKKKTPPGVVPKNNSVGEKGILKKSKKPVPKKPTSDLIELDAKNPEHAKELAEVGAQIGL